MNGSGGNRVTASNPIRVREIGLLALVIAVGFALRFVNINQWPLWGDEAMTLMVAQWSPKMLFLAPIDPTPGLYYALHKALIGPFATAAIARSISLACGALLIPASYFLAREARIPALLTAALVALSFPLIDYSQEARGYALLVLLVTCSAASFVGWARTQQPKQALLAVVFAALSFYTHLVSVFWIGPMLLATLWIGRRQAVQFLLLFVLLAIPEFARLLAYDPGNFSWLAQATPAEAANTLSRALVPFRPTGLWMAVPALVIAWRAWVHRQSLAAWGQQNRGAAFVLAVLVGFPIIIWLFGFVAKPIFMTRTILIGVPGFMAGLALLLKYEHRFARFGVVGLYAGSLLVTGTTREKDDWRAIAHRVGGDAVLLCQPWQAPAFRHALDRNNPIFLRYDRGLVAIDRKPWQTAYYNTILTRKLIAEAREQGARPSMALSPVWPIRTGKIAKVVTAPMTLGQAIATCDSYVATDRQQRYIAD